MKNPWSGNVWQKKKLGRAAALFLIPFTLFVPAFAQSPYQLRTGKEAALIGGGIITLGASVALREAVEPLALSEIATANRLDISAFDRGATYNWSSRFDKLSDVTLAGNAAILGLVTLGTKPMRQDIRTIGVMYIETLLLSNGIGRTVKGITKRSRPFVYNVNAPLDEKETRDARQSFFSGHATNAFATAVFTSEVFRHYFPDSKLRPVVWVGSLGLATATAVLRYEGGLHYPTDLLAGAAVGSLIGWGIPKLHEITNQTSLGRRLDIQPWSNGQANGIYLQLAVFSR